MKEKDTIEEIQKSMAVIESKIDLILSSLTTKPNRSKYTTAQDIEVEIGIDQRTILNRSNLPHYNKILFPVLELASVESILREK